MFILSRRGDINSIPPLKQSTTLSTGHEVNYQQTPRVALCSLCISFTYTNIKCLHNESLKCVILMKCVVLSVTLDGQVKSEVIKCEALALP